MKVYNFVKGRLRESTSYLYISMFLIAIISNAIILVTPIIQRKLLDEISLGIMDFTKIVMLGTISILGVLVAIIQAVFLRGLSIRIQNGLQKELLENAVRNNMESINSRGPGAYMVSVFGDSERIADLVAINVWEVIVQAAMVIAILIIATSWSHIFPIIVIPSFFLMTITQYTFNKIYIATFKKGRERVYEINPMVLEYLENRKSVLGYSNMNAYEAKLFQLFEERDREFRKADLYSTMSGSISNAIKVVSMVCLFVSSLFEIRKGAMQVSTFFALVSYLGIVYSPLESIKQFVTRRNEFLMFYEKIRPSLKSDIRLAIPKVEELSLVSCSLNYDNKSIISNVNISVDRRIGLIGMSGEGKTTLIRILLGELQPTIGECVYGGQNVCNISRYILYSSIRYYSQDTEIYNRNLEFNIAIGKIGISQIEYEQEQQRIGKVLYEMLCEVKEKKQFPKEKEKSLILKELFNLNIMQMREKELEDKIVGILSGLEDDIVYQLGKLYVSRKYYIEEKYDMLIKQLGLGKLIGREFGQRGSQISGGEKNRIALARFMLPEYGDFFILDEPLTNVDIMTEKTCLKILKPFLKNKKGIIISHKIEIVKSLADNIVVLNNGKISETGTHEFLLKNNKLYYTLWDEYIKKASK